MVQTRVDDVAVDRDAFGQARQMFVKGERELSQRALRTLAKEVVVRLSSHLDRAPAVEPPPSTDAIARLCHALMSSDEMAAPDLVLEARRAGMSADMICLGYIAGAARLLGEWWEEDRVGFVEMTLATSRMYALMRGLRDVFPPPGDDGSGQTRVCFVSTPGETHTLGVTMAADVLRRRGWQIDLLTGYSHDDLMREISPKDYMVFGISAGSERMLLPLIRLKVALRLSHPRAWIMICGKITEVVPDLAKRVDADLVATDVATAIEDVQKLMAQKVPLHMH